MPTNTVWIARFGAARVVSRQTARRLVGASLPPALTGTTWSTSVAGAPHTTQRHPRVRLRERRASATSTT
jgi:hypothetical protein